jgi:hypothetical protein
MMYIKKTIAGKDVYIVDSHHHVLAPWSLVRRARDSAPNLITLDHHTDIHPAFLRYAYCDTREACERVRSELVHAIDWQSDQCINEAISKLSYDEHIRAATRSDLINFAFVIHLDGMSHTSSIEQDKYYEDHPFSHFRMALDSPPPPNRPFTYSLPEDNVFVIEHGCAIGCSKIPHDGLCHVAHSDQVLEEEYLVDQIERANEMALSVGLGAVERTPYILDIDLDYFHTRKAIAPVRPAKFYELIRNSLAVTVAIEEECTQNLKVDGEAISTTMLLEGLYEHIHVAGQ